MPDMDIDAATDAGMDSDMEVDMDVPTCPEVPCLGEDVCVDNVCVPNTSCGTAKNLGTISPGDTVTDSGSFITQGLDQLTTSCAGAMATRERVIAFDVAERSLLSFEVDWTGQFDGVVSFRTTCADDSSETLCQDQESGARVFEPGTYYMVLEMKFGNAGTYALTINSQTAGCTIGESMCVDTTLEICPTGVEKESIMCPDACTNSACVGGSCSNAITVTAPGGTYTGGAGAFIGTLNFENNAGCGNRQSPGYEAVFYLPGLTAGQVVNVDTLTGDTNSNAIFITSACGDTSACVANYASEDIDWVVPANGDYYVIVDKVLNSRSEFSYTLNIF
ncbi:MAG: hypothetical protein R3E66_01690 [bacterium]